MRALRQDRNAQRETKRTLAPSKTVRADARVSAESVFSDRVWKMASVTTLPSWKHTSWDFGAVAGFPDGFALSLAEYAFHRLYKPVVTHDRQGSWPTVHNELTCLRTFASFCASEGCSSFAEVDAELCYDFYWFMREGDDPKSVERIDAIVADMYMLWEYRSTLSIPLPSIPFGHPREKLSKQGSGTARENRTPPIPEAIFGPLTGAALAYVLQFSGPILQAYGELQKAWDDDIKVTNLSISGMRKRLSRAASNILREIDSPWLRQRWRRHRGLLHELHQLRRACTIVVLAFSGIRLSELLALEAGCCVTDELEGSKVRHYVNTVLHKHRGVGSRDTWVVIDEVVKAIAILEQLSEDLRLASGDNRLFLSSGSNAPFSITSGVGTAERLYRPDSLIYQLNRFVARCNETLDRPRIPDWTSEEEETKPWQLNLRQFRRTLARYIAREPFGIIAGMLQYKHVEVACFEGYAGCEPSWNKLLEEEKALASVNILDEVAMDLSNGAVGGGLGDELWREFETEFKGRAEDFRPSQIAKWLADENRNLYVGKFNFCFFNKDKALCTKDSPNKDRPILNSCDPKHCKNSCVASRHAPVYKAQMEQAIELMRHPKATEAQRVVLTEQVEELNSVLRTIGEK